MPEISLRSALSIMPTPTGMVSQLPPGAPPPSAAPAPDASPAEPESPPFTLSAPPAMPAAPAAAEPKSPATFAPALAPISAALQRSGFRPQGDSEVQASQPGAHSAKTQASTRIE